MRTRAPFASESPAPAAFPYAAEPSSSPVCTLPAPPAARHFMFSTPFPAPPADRGANGPYSEDADELREGAAERLRCESGAHGELHYLYHYIGRTCASGRTPLPATLHAVFTRCEDKDDLRLQSAWIDMEIVRAGTGRMCGTIVRFAEIAAAVAQPPAFCGRTLSEILPLLASARRSRCFCNPEMINHKWRLALETIHWQLHHLV